MRKAIKINQINALIRRNFKKISKFAHVNPLLMGYQMRILAKGTDVRAVEPSPLMIHAELLVNLQ